MPAVPPDDEPDRRAGPRAPCPASFDGSVDKRCCLPREHGGLHHWRSPDGAQSFAWG